MNKVISKFNIEGDLIAPSLDKEDKKIAKTISKVIKGSFKEIKKLPNEAKEAVELYLNPFSKESIESLLFSEDITLEEISELLGTSIEVINEYAFWFCDVSSLNTFFKKRAYIETKIEEIKNALNLSNNEFLINELKSTLFKKWALMLGKEFVIWKFGLKKIDVSTANFLEILYKEAFFYYKEISMNEKDIDHTEFAKLISSLVKSIKEINTTMLQTGTDDNLIIDIQEALDIIIEEEKHPENNTVKKLTGEIVCNSKIN